MIGRKEGDKMASVRDWVGEGIVLWGKEQVRYRRGMREVQLLQHIGP